MYFLKRKEKKIMPGTMLRRLLRKLAPSSEAAECWVPSHVTKTPNILF